MYIFTLGKQKEKDKKMLYRLHGTTGLLASFIRYALLIESGFEGIFLFMGMICGYEKNVGKQMIPPLRYYTSHET